MVVRPVVEDLGERRCQSAPCGHVLVKNEHKHHVTFRSRISLGCAAASSRAIRISRGRGSDSAASRLIVCDLPICRAVRTGCATARQPFRIMIFNGLRVVARPWPVLPRGRYAGIPVSAVRAVRQRRVARLARVSLVRLAAAAMATGAGASVPGARTS